MTTLFSRTGEVLKATFLLNDKPVHRRSKSCSRCGGVGGADKWGPGGTNTGWTCWRCGGKGIDPNPEVIKLYTLEQNAKLDAVAKKKADKKAAMKAEAARVEQERRDRERAEIISANEGFIARIDAELAHGDIEVLRSVRERIVDRAMEPSERQIEVVNQIIERNEKERARRAIAVHIGEIKKRQDFTLTLVHFWSGWDELFMRWKYWMLFTDENGCKIASKSDPWKFGLRMTYPEGASSHEGRFEKGQTVRVKATVIEHTTDKRGEPLTYINRPKVID